MKKEIKTPKGIGNCYDRNGREFIDLCRKSTNMNVKYHMVHGIVINQRDKKPMGHGWIEATFTLGSVTQVSCLDFANGNEFKISKESYYWIGKIEGVVKYDYETFCKKIHDTGHWGHWDLNIDR